MKKLYTESLCVLEAEELKHCRRMSRLTNAFSKKLENFKAAIALHMAYYNLCKTHATIRATPAMEIGVEKSAVSIIGLLERCGE